MHAAGTSVFPTDPSPSAVGREGERETEKLENEEEEEVVERGASRERSRREMRRRRRERGREKRKCSFFPPSFSFVVVFEGPERGAEIKWAS